MGDLHVKAAFAEANTFLAPILQRELRKSRGASILEILGESLPGDFQDDLPVREKVISRALELLSQIHAAFATPVNDASQSAEDHDTPEDANLEDAKRRRILHALLDLVSLEGIYPSLSSGVGIPLQQRVISVLPAGIVAQQQLSMHETPPDGLLLRRILETLSDILFDDRPSIQPVIRGRILSDIISAASDLGYNPKIMSTDYQDRYRYILVKVIQDTPSVVLLQTLSSFLQSSPIAWFKSFISSQLSKVPLRSGGVLQTIMFLASQFAPSLGHESQTQGSGGPHITVNSIMHASRLLSSVPQGMDPVEYFSTIGPQLLALIDGEDPDLRKAAAYVVGNGILGKRTYGAPGTIGYSIFLEPIFNTLTGTLDTVSSKVIVPQQVLHAHSTEDSLVCAPELALAIDRLKTLVLQPPNPGLVKRVVYPVLIPLWGLACFTADQQHASLHENVMAVLKTYFGISVGLSPLKKIVDNFLWDGSPNYRYILDSADRVILQKREISEPQHNFVGLVDTLQSRTKIFMDLLSSDPSHDELTGEVFLYVSEQWLVKPSNPQTSQGVLHLTPDHENASNILRKVVSAKLAETLLENFKDTLSRRPLRVLELIKQILDGKMNEVTMQRQKMMERESGKMSLSSLANIARSKDSEGQGIKTESDSVEMLSAVFSLLSTILASPEFFVSQENSPLLESINANLDLLVPHFPPSLSKSGTTASMLLEILLTSPELAGSRKATTEVPDFATHRRALANLNSELPPVQAEGFSLLADLIKKSSPILDIPSTLTLLLSIITDSPESTTSDEFVYLNAIKLIGTLASRHPRTVVKTLIDRYIDRSESYTLDQRLKVGESILRTVQDLGEMLTGEVAKILGEGLISVAGRRAHKPQTQIARKQGLENEGLKKERDERQKADTSLPLGWKFSSPALSLSNLPGDMEGDESESETLEQAERSANIISAWAAGASADDQPDDLRVRASALSILATAVQTNITGLDPSILSAAVDLALSTLILEPEEESAILRRASAVLLLDLLKALDTARETRGSRNLGFGFSLADDDSWSSGNSNTRGPRTIGNIPYMLRTLAFVEGREPDSIVRGHVRVLVESLEVWIEKFFLWGIGDQTGDDTNDPKLELGGQIAGLRIKPLAGMDEGGRPRIEEIE